MTTHRPPTLPGSTRWVPVPNASRDRAIEQMHNRYGAALARVAESILRDRHAAEDAVQETWIRVLKHLDPTHPWSNPRAMLFQIVRNVALDTYRGRRRHSEQHRLSEALVARDTDAHEIVERSETLMFYGNRLASADELTRLVVSMDIAGLSGAEIAERVGISAGNARVITHRFAKRSRLALAEEATMAA